MTRERAYIATKGQRFGMLTVIDKVPLFKGPSKVLCRCDCNKEIEVFVKALLYGEVTHCGCQRTKREQHGESGTALYKIWLDIRRKDHNKKRVPLFTEWNKFTIFKRWAEFSGYCEGFEIKRYDTLRGHEPFNCYWHQDDREGNFDVMVGEDGLICTWWLKSGYRKIQHRHLITMQEYLSSVAGQQLLLYTRDHSREEVLIAIESEVDSRGLFR